MKICIFSPTLEVLGIVSNYDSLTHVRQFSGSGSFKLKAPFSTHLLDLLSEDNILFWEDAGRQYAVYIDNVICELEKKGEFITASGKNLRGLLGRRIVWENINFTGTVEDFARRIVNENAVNPSDTTRKIPLLSLETRKGLATEIIRQTENENLEDLLDDISAASEVGFDIILDKAARNLSFVSYVGTDRRTTQNDAPWVIVSRERNNVATETYTRSGASFRNAALISGYTDDETGERHEMEINAGSGLSRREIYVKGSGSKPKPDKDTGETEAEALARYEAELLQKGREKIAAQVNVCTLEVEPDSTLLEQLNVGDKVTAIEKRYGLMLQTYVSEITTYYGSGGRSFDVTLGDAVPTIYKKLRKEII
ncbi:siphovirus ReqiPepy6 Gp37-like family protein [Faecalispora jeddahensis]|uniref:siphovirus ReqiPepy6 Gp37-like family protein n=1 Tax=Faecalispora jeddahensis TaxID=1414721 RepID=UPI001A9C11C8|nr:siphovirus ReqiPepy6 Gp37-like family protein [Faecalispora jeddahensis]